MESESESESEWDLESSTDSHSLSENDREKKGKRAGERKIRKQTYSRQNLRQIIENKLELSVTCGDKDGVLNVEKYNNMQACIFSEGQCFKPKEFEIFGGKERSKKWRNSISHNGTPLQDLIKDGLLSPFKKIPVQNEQNDSPGSSPITDRLRKGKNDSPGSSPITDRLRKRKNDSPGSSPITDRLRKRKNDSPESSPDRFRKRKCRKQLRYSSSESEGRINGSEDGDVDSDDVSIDMSVFEGPTLPVTCGSGFGILHKCRFAKGYCGRCIRTKEFWLSPGDFTILNKPDGTWRKDIVTNGIPLGKLIMKRVLELHMINCDCEICEEPDHYLNDDVCFVCDSEGDLVCCDKCPRAFHSHCHLPAVDGDSPGSQWSCTFCVIKNMEDSSRKTQQDVLSSPVSQYTQHCQCLLLQLLHDCMTDSCTNVPGYSKNICGPMMLGRVKLELENNAYQTVQEFVSDIKLIFNNFSTSSADNDSSKMTSRLKEVFKKEFKTVFKLL
ncbi:nuclear body protein SP140-like isoform X3 [Rhinichthys klamathensis goyatoka]|uniref:nuclear body protein SP140-like isoform X3 n=1 Tax=Rhinichthys klamathensis goyatoka TaxID=3034132 RepID=UPI0024B5688C|nr:nuclear body protein SP140-like isoform X3 [Rhinichthys klamathensis goyatoka]